MAPLATGVPLSSTVTVLGLRPTGVGDLAGWLRNCADVGEPAVLTLAQLRRWPMNALDRSEHIYDGGEPLAHQ